jgi:hypothetical protein
MIWPALAGAAMTADEARTRAAYYRAVVAQQDIDPALRETLFNLVNLYEAYIARLDKEALAEFPTPAA